MSASASTSTSIAAVYPQAIDHLPPKQPNTTRFVLLSDTHTHTFPVPHGDVLLHAGDLTERGSAKELKVTIDWLCSLPHPHKIIIAGNHDYCLDGDFLKESISEKDYEMYLKSMEMIHSAKAKDAGLIYLKDEMVEIPILSNSGDSVSPPSRRSCWKIFGSPWSAAFCSMAFNVPRGDASSKLYSEIPDSTEILLTHGPPLGMLDVTRHGNKHVGCDALLSRLKTGLPHLKLHIWGHIHEDRGVITDEEGMYGNEQQLAQTGNRAVVDIEEGTKRKGTIFINAANAGTFERPTRLWGEGKYQPMVVDLRNDA